MDCRGGVADGYVFRPVNRGGQAQAAGLSEKVVWQLLQGICGGGRCSGNCAPRSEEDLREDVPGGRRRTGADPAAAGSRIRPNDRTISRHEAGSGARAERRNQTKIVSLNWPSNHQMGRCSVPDQLWLPDQNGAIPGTGPTPT